jgi:glucose/arabinose dehydrogenase
MRPPQRCPRRFRPYVANTAAIVRYPYNPGDTKITAPGTTLTPLPRPD